MASTFESILTLLDKWPRWKRINDMPDQLDDLVSRMAALEKRLEKRPEEDCPYCGEPSLRLTLQWMNAQWEKWTCQSCGKEKDVRHDLAGKNAQRG